jgi:hypothetical protein
VKKLFILSLLILAAVGAVAQTVVVGGGGAGVTTTTVAALGTPATGTLATVTDGASTTDCVTGGGSYVVVCLYNGSAWASPTASGSMVYPGAGIPSSTGTGWSTSIASTGTGKVLRETGAVSVGQALSAASDAPSAVFRRFGAAQTSDMVEFQTELNARLAGIDKSGIADFAGYKKAGNPLGYSDLAASDFTLGAYSIIFSEIAAPANPSAGNCKMYMDSTTHLITFINSTGAACTATGSASPLSTKGDIFVYGTTNDRLPVGTDTYVLTADSTQALGVKWAAPSATGLYTAANNATAAAGNKATSGTCTWKVNNLDQWEADCPVKIAGTAGAADLTEVAAPSAPAAGTLSTYADSTTHRFNDENSSGVIGTTVVGAAARTATQFVTNIGVDGVQAKAAIAVADVPTMTSAELRGKLSDEVGTGAAYFVGGALGTPASGVITNLTGTCTSCNVGGTAANVSGTPALPNGTTATSQSANDNSTKLATTAYVDGQNVIVTTGLTAGHAYYISAANTLSEAGGGISATAPAVCVAVSTTVCRTRGTYTTTGLTAGAVYYVPTTAAVVTTTAPSSTGQFVQRIGVALSTTVLLINPSLDVGTVQ